MDKSQEILSDIVIFNKYAKYIPELNRRESWKEICIRNMNMHLQKYPSLTKEIQDIYYEYVIQKKVLPSMRSMQFGGRPIELSNVRIFNCSYNPIDHPFAFAETMFLLLSGCGVGYSVRKRHIEKLPVIKGPINRYRRFLISDNIEGWADAIKVLVKAYTNGKSDPIFDFRDIRHKGALLVTAGGKAPGPDPLKICIEHLRSILNNAIGRKLTSVECHDICCHISDAVLSGGIRRSACIVGFDPDDEEMLACKTGNWWELNPQRGRANNSVILNRKTTNKEDFLSIWKRTELSGAGEPGFYWTNSEDGFCNPCVETFLEPHTFCNLTDINASDITTQEEFNNRARVGAFLGTLQAGYTDFHYLRQQWKENTERDALIGVGITGIANEEFLLLNDTEAANIVVAENKRVANIIGINEAVRTTVVKPSGTSSCVVGSSSGIHAWHNDYYIRRIRVGKNEALYKYLLETNPSLLEDCVFKPHIEAIISIPQKAPEGAVLRTESVFDLLERVKHFNQNWIYRGHNSGDNMHNTSCTISVKDDEWDSVGEWMWENRKYYTGIAVLPYDGHTYKQAPFENITKEQYEEMVKNIHSIDLTQVKEHEDNTDLSGEAACFGGQCTIV